MALGLQFRLAFRIEGDFWNAYYVPHRYSMKDAILLGSLRLSLASIPSIKSKFMVMMKDAFNYHVRELTGRTIKFNPPQVAPENERTGNS